MSNGINLPTKSEIEGKTDKESEIITLNIYNNNNNIFTETTDKYNQTEENLYIKDNYNNLIKPNRNNIIYYDNVREKSNNYPLSERKGIQPPTAFNNNNYYKSVNPYLNNNNYQINNNNKFNGLNINNINNEGAKRPIIYHPKKKEEKPNQIKKNNSKNMVKICCIGTFLFFVLPPIGILYCCFNLLKNEK